MTEQTQPLAPRTAARNRFRLADFNEITIPAITLVAVVLLWEVVCQVFSVPEYLVPAPSRIWADSMLMKEAMAEHTLVSVRTILLGFVLSIAVSFPLAVLITYSRFLNKRSTPCSY